VFRVIYNPTLAGGGVRVRARKRKRVKESGVIRAEAKGEGDFAGGRREGEVKERGVDEQ
jgi:hypothetical protein